MQIVEVKNNLVRISYDTATENLILSGFVVIKDSLQSFIGQIIHLEANSTGNFAIVKLLFTFDDQGVITTYNGAIPDIKCAMDIVQPQELLELLPVEIPLTIGELAQQQTVLTLDMSTLEEKLLVCCEKEDDSATLSENFTTQLAMSDKKVLIIDLNGNLDFSQNKIIAGENFKLPLNYETINFIYQKGLDDAKAETKALIQEIFLEVQNYVKTLEEQFIPFENFKNVVDAQYQETEMIELVLLKNKLLKYYDEGIFAQEKDEFETLEASIQSSEPTILDLSQMDSSIQREMISYAYSLIDKLEEEVHVILSINDSNSDKKLLKQIFTTKNAYSVPICSYSYKYLKELKQLSKNLILFAPIQQQNDFASYNIFLNKLNAHEFVIYGQKTQHMPLIVKLEAFNPEDYQVEDEDEEQPSEQDLLDEQIKQDVDQIFTAPRREPEEVDFEEENIEIPDEEELTEEDLDLIDDLNIVENEPEEEYQEETIDIEEEPPEEPHLHAVENILEEDETVEAIPAAQVQPEPPPVLDILPANMSSTPIVPVYSADIEPQAESDEIEQGDTVVHPKYGKGTVEKLISYGAKTLCSIQFDNVGRRLLDPSLAEIKKVDD